MKCLIATALVLLFSAANLSAQTGDVDTSREPDVAHRPNGSHADSMDLAMPQVAPPPVGPQSGARVQRRQIDRLADGGRQRAFILQQYEQMLAAQREAGIEDPIRRAEQVIEQRPDRFDAVRQVRYGDPLLQSAPRTERIPASTSDESMRHDSASLSSFWEPAPRRAAFLEQPKVPPVPGEHDQLLLGPDDDPFDRSLPARDSYIDDSPLSTRRSSPSSYQEQGQNQDQDQKTPENPFADPSSPEREAPMDDKPVPKVIQAPDHSTAVPPMEHSALPPIVTPEQAMRNTDGCDQPLPPAKNCDSPVCDTPVGSEAIRVSPGHQRPRLNALPRVVDASAPFGLANLRSQVFGATCDRCDGSVVSGDGRCDVCGSRASVACGACVPTVYYSVFGGFASANGFDRAAPSSGTAASYSFDDAFAIGGAIGQIQGPQLRTELEFAYRDHDLGQVTLLGPSASTTFNGSGELRAYSGMTNVYWEFVNSPLPALHPYVGAGVGFAFFKSNFAIQGNSITSSDYENDSAFAYQAMAGLNWCTAPNTSMFLEYRYFATDSIRIAGTIGGNAVNDKFDYQSNNIFAGIRFKF